MSPEMKLERQNKRPVSKPSAAQSTVEPEPVEEFEDEYDDEAEGEYQEEPSIMEAVHQFSADDRERGLIPGAFEQVDSTDLETAENTAQTLTPEQVQAVVNEINKIAVDTVDKGKMDIGEYVLSVVFKDDLEAVSSQSPYKNTSLSEIAQHPDLLVDRRQLGTWVRAAAFRRKLIQANVDCSQFTYSHFAALFRLKKEEKQIELATEMSRDNLSVRQILDRIEASKRGKSSNQPHKDLLKKVEDPFKLMEDKEATDLLSDPEKLAEMTSGDRVDIVKAIDKTESQIKKSHKFLREAKKHILQIELGPYQETEV